MSHVRQQVRDGFKAKLAGIPGVRTITSARPHNYDLAELPAIVVITPTESIEPLDQSQTETMRRIATEVTIIVAGDTGADDAADAIAAEVETRILAATGEPFDSMVMHFPTGADLSIGEPSETTIFALRTRFECRFSATNAETIG